MPLAVRCHRSFEDIGAGAWDALHAQAAHASVFQSWSWLQGWAHTFATSDSLRVFVAREGAEVLGALALVVDTASAATLCFIGDAHGDYQNALVPAGRDDVLRALLRAALSECDALRLADVRSDTALARVLGEGGEFACVPGDPVPCPRVRFADVGAAALLRKESLRRSRKRLEGAGPIRTRHLRTAGEIEPLLPAFFRQHVERWAERGTPSLFRTQANRDFYSRLAASALVPGPLVFTVVESGSVPVAMHFGFFSERDFVWYKPTFDVRRHAQSPGEVLLAELIAYADAERVDAFDFTRGGEAFKLRYASEIRECRTYEVYASALTAASVRAGRDARALARRVAHATGTIDLARAVRARLRERGVEDGDDAGAAAPPARERARKQWIAPPVAPSGAGVTAPHPARLAGAVAQDAATSGVRTFEDIGALLDAFAADSAVGARVVLGAATRFARGERLLLEGTTGEPCAYAWWKATGRDGEGRQRRDRAEPPAAGGRSDAPAAAEATLETFAGAAAAPERVTAFLRRLRERSPTVALVLVADPRTAGIDAAATEAGFAPLRRPRGRVW